MERFIPYFLIVFLTMGITNFTRAENLQEAWQIALHQDLRIQAAQDEVAAANHDLTAAQRRYRPSLINETSYQFLSGDPAFNFGGNQLKIVDQNFAMTSMMAKMPLYTGGQISGAIDAASCQSSAAGSNVEKTILDIKLGVATAYTQVLREKHNLDVAESMVRSLKAHKDKIEIMLQRGEVPRNDLLASEVELANAQQDLIVAGNRLANAQALYNRQLSRPLESQVVVQELEVPPLSGELEPLTQEAMRRRPEISALAARANALRHQARSVQGATHPHFGAEGGLLYLESPSIRPNAYGAMMFGLEWTPYDGGMTRSKVNALRSKANSLDRLRADLTRSIRLSVHNTWRDERESRQRIEVTQKAIDQAEENLRVAKVRFAQGAAINTEVLDAETLRTQTYKNYYDSIYGAVLATFRLRRAVGTL